MLNLHLHKFFAASIKPLSANGNQCTSGLVRFWLSLSLGFGLFYGILGLRRAFRDEYVVQDDAREYVFWMQRFVDSQLLPNDLIANYFKSVTPPGYAFIYKVMANLGVSPLLLSKILPIFLGVIVTIYCFRFSLKLFPVPLGAFIITLLLNQSLWFKDDLVSGVPRSFIYPLLLAFLYYLLCESWLIISLIIILEALFYPLLVFVCLGILCWRLWQKSKYRFIIGILVLSFLALLPYALSSSEFAPVVSRSQAWQMDEHWTQGRHPFFEPNPWKFWLIGEHSGILPALMPPLIWIGLLFPWLRQHPLRFPLISTVNNQGKLLFQVVIVSVALYFFAHVLFLKLFFPTRHTVHSLRVVMAIISGVSLTAILDALFRTYENIKQSHQQKRSWKILFTIIILSVLLLYPNFYGSFPRTNYRTTGESALFTFLQQQPKDTMVASLSDEADNIPTFGKRSILVSMEYALPFHLGYYSQIRQRTIDLINAQYSPDLAAAKQLIQKYQVNFFLLEHDTFQTEYLTKRTWLKSFQPAFNDAITNLEAAKTPAIAKLKDSCKVFKNQRFDLLDAQCVYKSF